MPDSPIPLRTVGFQPTETTRPQAGDPADDALRRAAMEFEAVFLAEMLAPMFEGLDSEGLGGGGMGEQIFRPMLVERYAEAISRSGGVGVAESVIREMLRLQTMIEPQEEAANGVDR